MRLAGKIALVTGASRSIGREIAIGFAKEGADVAVNYDRNQEAAERVIREIESIGRSAIAVQADVSNASQVAEMVSRVLATFGRIDVLVNNAGINARVPFLEMSEDLWDRVIAVDLKGVYLVSQAVARHMVAQGGGTIVNTSSLARDVVSLGIAHYSSAKAGVYMLTRSMAYELAPYNIRVNSVEPGLIETDLNRKRLAEPKTRSERMGKIPMARFGRPEDLVGAYVYLASDESAFTTGASLRVDGGQTTW